MPDSGCPPGPLQWTPSQPYAITCNDARTSEHVGALWSCFCLVEELYSVTFLISGYSLKDELAKGKSYMMQLNICSGEIMITAPGRGARGGDLGELLSI